MKPNLVFPIFLFVLFTGFSCKDQDTTAELKIIFLHHSTGMDIWNGAQPSIFEKAAGKISPKLKEMASRKPKLPELIHKHNREAGHNYQIVEEEFPKKSPYGWNNYPFDYYNIWVKNAGEQSFMEEPTLEMLTNDYQVIIFKHCFPVSNIQSDSDSVDIDSDTKTIANYRLQYLALRNKLHEFPKTKFILFTGAVQVEKYISEAEAIRAQEFFSWVTSEWDVPNDNIYIWDFYSLQTEGGLCFKNEYALSEINSHPNGAFARKMAKLLAARIIDVIETSGKETHLTGEAK